MTSPSGSFPFFPPPFPQHHNPEKIDQFVRTFLRPMGERKRDSNTNNNNKKGGSSVCTCTCHRFCDTLAASRQRTSWPQQPPSLFPPPFHFPSSQSQFPPFPSFPPFSQFPPSPSSSPSLVHPGFPYSPNQYPQPAPPKTTTKKRKRESEKEKTGRGDEVLNGEVVVSVNEEWAIRFMETAERRKKRKADREKEFLLRLTEEQKNKKLQEEQNAQLLYGQKKGQSSIPQSLRQLEGQLNASLDTWSDKHAPVKFWPVDPLNFKT